MADPESVYRFSTMVLSVPVGIAAISALAGVYLVFRRSHAVAWVGCFALALFTGAFIAPMLIADRVVVTPRRLEQTTGFWWSPTVKGFVYDEVDRVTLATGRDHQGRPQAVWHLHRRDGSVSEIDPGDLWELNEDEIVRELRGHGVRIESAR